MYRPFEQVIHTNKSNMVTVSEFICFFGTWSMLKLTSDDAAVCWCCVVNRCAVWLQWHNFCLWTNI